MFDQVTVRVADRAASEHFYRTTLGAIGIESTDADNSAVAWDDFAIRAADAEQSPTRNLHLAFVSASRSDVDRFWRAGVEAGFEDDGPPGERPQYTPSYYGAFLRDPGGNSAEAVHHADTRRGGHVDHLWIRVPDLEEAVVFYTAIMPHAGMREGRRWEDGRQFRGAWATLSLVADGAPVTEGVQIAFPALDRETVEGFRRAALGAGYDEAVGPTTSSPEGSSAAFVCGPGRALVGSVFRGRSARA